MILLLLFALFVLFVLFAGLSFIGRLFGFRRRRMYDSYMMPPMFGRRYERWGFGGPRFFEEGRHHGHHHQHHHHHHGF